MVSPYHQRMLTGSAVYRRPANISPVLTIACGRVIPPQTINGRVMLYMVAFPFYLTVLRALRAYHPVELAALRMD